MKEITAKNSLCWTCKHGICVQEQQQDKLYHPTGNIHKEEPNGWLDNDPDEEEVEVLEQIIETNKPKTICFWRPNDTPNSIPMLMAFIASCNRYEKQ